MKNNDIMNWRDEDTTKQQEISIIKYCGILGWNINIPKKRGDACDLIKRMMAEVENGIPTKRISAFEDDAFDEMEDDCLAGFEDDDIF